MPNYVNVRFRNDSLDQRVFTITDDVMEAEVWANKPLAGHEATEPLRLVVDQRGFGQATWKAKGGVANRAEDLMEDQQVDMG